MTSRTTARGIVNRALILLGHIQISTDALFDTGILDYQGNMTTRLDKYQQQGVTAYETFHNQLAMTMNKPFMFRRFVISTAAPNSAGTGFPIYTIKDAVFEALKADSFFNITYGSGPGNRIGVIPEEQFNEMYARADLVPIGAPLYLCKVVEDGSDICKVRLIPTPDQVYQIEGQVRYTVPEFKSGSQLCVFPRHYQHGLIMKLVEFLETRVNEGREGTIRAYAEQFIDEIIRDATGADEEVDRLDMGFRLYGGRGSSVRDYNPATDAAGPYP